MNSEQMIVEGLLDLFKAEMLVKLKLRAEKHPDDNFLSMSVDQILVCPLGPIIAHMNEEIEELRCAGPNEENVMKEDVDVANMAFIEWAIRWVRKNRA